MTGATPSAEAIKAWIKADWNGAPYYEDVETDSGMYPFWGEGSPFLERFALLDHRTIVDLACGQGRHAARVLKDYEVERLIAVDVNESNIEVCARRFGDDSKVACIVNTGSDLSAIEDGSVSAVFSYDAMVHFEYDDVISYIGEFRRVLRPGGRALIHHSNNDKQPGNLCEQNTHWRNFMSAPLFAHVAMRAGFKVIDQTILDWVEAPRLDCLSFIESA